ncbi:hypothetical protein CTI12_AA365690 [Artemisia annua]|uniref:Zinc finger GRF-type domain-containing protein n=1 Tax=Artemisia annua TaxID=35608 RepID=A0A2U1MMF7_ARTAN|nr:hypothetical protein CTI12_AA365690 [Artemisia annua]
MRSSSSFSRSSFSRSNRMTLQEAWDATHCKCSLPVEAQVAWTLDNPGRRFKACPIYDENDKCDFYGFLDPELPTDYYRYLFFNLHEENKNLKNMLKTRRNYGEGSSSEMGKMKEELTEIRSKVGVIVVFNAMV